jgi:hypothetical protein
MPGLRSICPAPVADDLRERRGTVTSHPCELDGRLSQFRRPAVSCEAPCPLVLRIVHRRPAPTLLAMLLGNTRERGEGELGPAAADAARARGAAMTLDQAVAFAIDSDGESGMSA